MDQDKPEIMSNAIELSLGQRFELEKMNRAVDGCESIEELKSLTKSLISAWMTQKAAVAWMLRQQLERK